MNITEITKLLTHNGFDIEAKISPLGKGEANENYLYQTPDKKLVVRTVRADRPGNRSFQNEYEMLGFLESQGIDFSPQSLWYDPKNEVHVISYTDGLDCSIVDLPEKHLATFVKNIVTLENLSYDSYSQFAEENNFTLHKPQSSHNSFVQYGLRTYENILSYKNDPDVPEILNWLEPKMSLIQEDMQRWPEEIKFVHADLRWHPGGGNLRYTFDELHFIDWELSMFINSNRFEIADVITSIPDPDGKNKELIKKLLLYYIQETNSDKELFADQLLYCFRFYKLIDVLWSANLFMKLRSQSNPDWIKYKEMTEYRMMAGLYYFELDSLQI